jgi:triacylglycerol lipase
MKSIRLIFSIALLCLSTALSASGQVGVNFVEIREMARFASAAYESETGIHHLVESSDYKLVHYHTIQDVQVAYFLAFNEISRTQIISIRGTSNIENAMVDISLKLRQDADTGVPLHKGFAYSAKQVFTELKPLLKPDYKTNLTGHSLGGAVALILAMYLDENQFNVDRVVTFGQPKVTNIPGAAKVQHLDIIRVVTPHDLVPLIPFFDPLDINNLDIFWHAGKEVILLEDTSYAILEGASSMLRATKFTQKPLSKENLNDHKMLVYLNLIDARMASSILVTYKTDFNLFNLFGSE